MKDWVIDRIIADLIANAVMQLWQKWSFYVGKEQFYTIFK